MNHKNQSFNNHAVKGWQLLGTLKLSRDLDVETTIHKWLLEILKQLELHVGFFDKLTLSMQEAAMTLLKPGPEQREFEHIHLLVFARRKQTESPPSWGFFRIEKVESAVHENDHPDHAVEFYLYPE